MMTKILLTNDDGVESPHIHLLKKELEHDDHIHPVTVAPRKNQSGASQSLTLIDPIFFEQVNPNYFIVDGSPTDCVKIALSGLNINDVSLVVSGINQGANIGLNTYYSGTVAAAREAFFQSISGVCFSFDNHFNVPSYVSKIAYRFIKKIVTLSSLKHPYLLNINFPNLSQDKIKGIRITQLNRSASHNIYIQDSSPFKRSFFWLKDVVSVNSKPEENDDIQALRDGYISLCPLNQNVDNGFAIKQLKQLLQAQLED